MRISSNQDKAILRFHNRIVFGKDETKYLDDIFDIPDDTLHFYRLFCFDELINPFIRERLVAGKSQRSIAKNLDVTKDKVVYVGSKAGLASRT